MFKTAKELQDFIVWARENRVKRFKTGTTEVELSELAFIDGPLMEAPLSQVLNTEIVQTEDVEKDNYGRPVDDPDLFHSVSN